jgi:hypothetical protein
MDAFLKPLFGKTERGVVFYPMGDKARPHPVTPSQVEQLRTATAVTLVIIGVMVVGGVTFAAVVTLLIVMSPNVADLGFDPRLLYLGDVLQVAFIAIVVLIYKAVVASILRRP